MVGQSPAHREQVHEQASHPVVPATAKQSRTTCCCSPSHEVRELCAGYQPYQARCGLRPNYAPRPIPPANHDPHLADRRAERSASSRTFETRHIGRVVAWTMRNTTTLESQEIHFRIHTCTTSSTLFRTDLATREGHFHRGTVTIPVVTQSL